MHLLTNPAREAWNPSRAGEKGLSGQTCRNGRAKRRGFPCSDLVALPVHADIPKSCPLKINSPLHKKNAEAALTRLHRGCEGYDNGLVNYLCVLSFLFFFWQSW